MKIRPALIPLAAAVFFAAISAAWGMGELSQKPGTAGCFSLTAAEGCQEAKAIDGADDVVVSPDGRHAYVAAFGSDAVAVFDRDPDTGALIQRPGDAGCISNSGGNCRAARALDGPAGLVISPDGANVYVTARESDAVAVLDRDPATGNLSQDMGLSGCISQTGAGGCAPGRVLDGAGALAITADGRNVYVASAFSNAVAILGRNAAGDLSQPPGLGGCISNDGTGGACQPGAGLENPLDVAASPDGANVYVAHDLGVSTLSRDSSTGALTQPFAPAALRFANTLAVSPDGRNVYAAAALPRLALYDRSSSGALTQKPGPGGCFSRDGSGGACQPARGMDGVGDLTVSPDGASVYLAGIRSLLIFDRDPAIGALAQKAGAAGCISSDGTGGACQLGRGMTGIESGLTMSPEGRSVYLTAGETDAIAIFDRALPPPADTLAPTVTGFEAVPKRFEPGSKKKKGTRFRFVLSEAAAVRIEIERPLPGRRVGKQCKPAAPKLKKHKACRFFKRRGELTAANGSAGANAIRFSGRIGKRALRPGAYRATIVATDAAGNRSAPRQARFTVLAPSAQRR